jgi:hypothetical protein
MSNILSTLKVKFSSDTTELKKGTEESKKAINDLSKSGQGAIDELAGVFGTSLGAIGGHFTAFKGTIGSLTTAFKGAAAGSGGFAGSLKILKVALISTGIGAIVVALGSLVAYFTSTERGAQKLSVIMAGFGAVFSVIIDRLSLFGEAIVNAFTNPRKAIESLWGSIKSYFVDKFESLIGLFGNVGDALKALFSRDWDGLKKAAGDAASNFLKLNPVVDIYKGLANGVNSVAKEMAAEAKAAMNLKEQLNALEVAERNMRVTTRQREAAVKALNLVVEDVTKADAVRQAAAEKALNIQRAMLNEERALASERVRILKAQQDLSENVAADYEALADAEAKLAEVDARVIEQMTTMNNKLNILNKSIVDRRKATDDYLKTIDPMANMAKQANAALPDAKAAFDKFSQMALDSANASALAVTQTAGVIPGLTSAVNDALAGMAVGIGEALGNIMIGVGDFSQIGTVILSSLADLLMTVGKMAIETGIATLAIKMSLNTLNGGIAIAAGVALVALATAVKGGMSKAASGGGGSSLSSINGSANNIDARAPSRNTTQSTAEMNIIVSGEFRQRGPDLVAVVAKENNRKQLTT